MPIPPWEYGSTHVVLVYELDSGLWDELRKRDLGALLTDYQACGTSPDFRVGHRVSVGANTSWRILKPFAVVVVPELLQVVVETLESHSFK